MKFIILGEVGEDDHMLRLPKLLFFTCILTLIAGSCKTTGTGGKHTAQKGITETNHLAGESSPYLLQHAHNPVDWYPWGKEALDKAKKENKLIIISVGYAACHWCHVMEEETFSDAGVAAYMNENFVAIKVDREERPDIDQVYMNALILLNGSGGWPLNAIALPDGRPLAAGTYFPKRNWLSFLEEVMKFYNRHPEDAAKQAELLNKGMRTTSQVQKLYDSEAPAFTARQLEDIYDSWIAATDLKRGGAKGAPKFPLPLNYEFMLEYYYHTRQGEALQAVTATLENMAMGGIYDQLGGGFARYSTDKIWKVPHFEKMLYDNAQLVSLYTHAWQLTHKPLYRDVVYKTLDFIDREMTSPEGGFYSSLDADSDGEEGKYYVWRKKEVNEALGEDAGWYSDYYNILTIGNWEKGKNILYRDEDDSSFAPSLHISREEFRKKLDAANEKLLKLRQERQRPRKDDKIITAWNALMISGYTQAYRAFGEPRFLNAALKNAELIEKKLHRRQYQLYRILKDDKASINAYMDDYAYLIQAYIDLYEATFDEKWLEMAKGFSDHAIEHFRNNDNSMFYFTADNDPQLVVRKMEVEDNVTPASNSVMAKNLFRLGIMYDNARYKEMSSQMLKNIQDRLQKGGAYYANWSSLMMKQVWPVYEVAIVGKDADELRQAMDNNYLPDALYLGAKKKSSLPLLEEKFSKGESIIYVCQKKVCKLPVKEPAEAVKQIRQ